MVRVSGYGQTGPERDKAGFGMTCQARSGVTYMTGFPDGPPLNPPFALADYTTGIFAALSTMIALYYRDTIGGGRGQCIDLAVYEGLFRLQEFHPALWDKLGIIQERCGNDPGVAPPTGMWMSKDGKWVSLTCSNDNVFKRLAETMGQAELATDPRFVDMASRVQNRVEINEITQEWIGARSLEEVVDGLMSAGVPAGPVQNMADIFQDRLFWERENIVEVQDPVIGPVKLPNVIGKLSLTPGKVRSTGPRLGQHNDETFKGFLGYSDEKIAALKNAGAI